MNRNLSTDHKNLDLTQLNLDVIRGTAGGKVIWQPRICCWYDDRIFKNGTLDGRYAGFSLVDLYKDLGCSNRIYDFNACFQRVEDPEIRRTATRLPDGSVENVCETPVGTINSIYRGNESNPGWYPQKWWATCEADIKVLTYVEDHCDWKFDRQLYDQLSDTWKGLGQPSIFMPRTTIQAPIVEFMGVEETIYALNDYPETMETYFDAIENNMERMIEVINESPIELINFGDNVHSGIVPDYLFEKYLQPAYLRRNEHLHKAGKFTYAHWDGDCKGILKYATRCGLDGIEAITPVPQGDVTIEEVKEALGDTVYLFDGIPAILFDPIYPEQMLVDTVNEILEAFAPRLVLGISDEMSSAGDIERVRLVGRLVDEYNAKL